MPTACTRPHQMRSGLARGCGTWPGGTWVATNRWISVWCGEQLRGEQTPTKKRTNEQTNKRTNAGMAARPVGPAESLRGMAARPISPAESQRGMAATPIGPAERPRGTAAGQVGPAESLSGMARAAIRHHEGHTLCPDAVARAPPCNGRAQSKGKQTNLAIVCGWFARHADEVGALALRFQVQKKRTRTGQRSVESKPEHGMFLRSPL
jgi:hypothetical protein